MAENGLAGKAVLVVEDEFFTATVLRRDLVQAGATVIGPAPSLKKALALIESAPRIDYGILDVNLGGELVYPAADRLRERAVPFLFATGYDPSMIPPRFSDVPRCEKPVGPDDFSRALDLIAPKT